MNAWLLRGVASYVGWAYHRDVVVRPESMAKLARAYCTRVGKPLLNIGAGTPASSLRALMFGPQLCGDVNIDIAAPRDVTHGKDRVSYGDAQQPAWPDKAFGAIFAAHVLEHLDRPDLAIAEWRRVADRVFVVSPSWWAPHTYAHPGHKWFLTNEGTKAYPLWTSQLRILPLPPLR